jgi:TDG/mug DNA glycosylase family protein
VLDGARAPNDPRAFDRFKLGTSFWTDQNRNVPRPSTSGPLALNAKPPTRAELLVAYGTTVPDLAFPGMRLLICGINPSLWSGHAGYHFARPANRLWRSLEQSGLTPRLLHPSETDELGRAGIGITNFVRRSTARADELTREEIQAGVGPLRRLAKRHSPQYLAILGLGAYRIAFGDRNATVGPLPFCFGNTRLWLLPNPSGLNAHYDQPALSAAFRELRFALDKANTR